MKKRIALAAVAALAGGLIVAAPASAVLVTTADTPFYVSIADTGVTTDTATASMTATQVAGSSNYVAIKADKDQAAGSKIAVTVTGSTILSATAPTAAANETVTINAAATQATYVDQTTVGSEIKIATPTAGTITATVAKITDNNNGQFTTTTLQTFTFTVTAAGVSGVVSAADSAAAMTAVTNVSTLSADSKTVTAEKGYVKVADIAVTLEDANGHPLADGANADTVVAISGAGILKVVNATAAANNGIGRSLLVSNEDDFDVEVWGDGSAGTGTITITSGAFTATLTVVFYGDVATLSATAVKKHIADGATTQDVLLVVAKDAAGNVVPGKTVSIAAADTTVITSTTGTTASATEIALGDGTIALTAAADKSGAQTLTVTYDATVDVTTTVVVGISDPQATTLTIVADKAEYAPGEKMTFTITAKDKNGLGIPDDTYLVDELLKATPAVTTALSSVPFSTGEVELVAGVATATAYAPLIAGPLSVVYTLPGTAGTATTELSAALAGSSVTVSAKVVAPVDATVTAINAKVASTEATVAALQVTVASVIKSLKVQWWLLKKIAVKVGIKLG